MTITIDTTQFLQDSLERILKQTHLSDKYSLGFFSPSDIPSAVKKLAKGIIPADFFNGVKAKIIVLKANDPSEASEDDSLKIAKFIKTTFFLTDDSPFSTNDIYQVKDLSGEGKKKDADDNEDTGETIKAMYFFAKLELKN